MVSLSVHSPAWLCPALRSTAGCTEMARGVSRIVLVGVMANLKSTKSTGYTFEVLGIDPRNKGALLMLHACCEQIRQRYRTSRIAISYRVDPALRLELGLWSTLPRDTLRAGLPVAWEHLPHRVCSIGGLVRRSEIDVTLDASGFAYGDAWPRKKLQNRLVRTALEKRKGAKLILLPQSFGPFERFNTRRVVGEAIANVDLVFARDEPSFLYLQDAAVEPMAHIRSAPDFTNLLTAPDLGDQALARETWIVPNIKVFGAGLGEPDHPYIRFLARAVDLLTDEEIKPRILIHEGAKDEAVASQLNAALAQPLEIYRPANALEAKAVLSAAHLVISSRYHALVSALAAGVPSLACGWSHKYEALMKDYALSDATVDLDNPADWDYKILQSIAASRSEIARSNLRKASAVQKKRSEDMWRSVFRCIEEVEDVGGI